MRTQNRALQALLTLAVATVLAFGVEGCSGADSRGAVDALAVMRDAARSGDGEAVGRWLLGELLAPGGDAAKAIDARKRLDSMSPKAGGMFASLARAFDDESHGRFQAAAHEHLAALAAARTDPSPDAELVAWFSANRLLGLRSSVRNLWDEAKTFVASALDQPGHIGWRARAELVEWWTLDGFHDAPPTASLLDEAAKRYGCVQNARMAGPFGHLARGDHRTRYEAERAGPWPMVFAKDPQRLEPPRVMKIERVGCALHAIDGGPGVYYLETFIDLSAEREVIVAAQGELAVFVDDVEILTRDTRQWGIWPRFGAHVRLSQGRHRVLARVAGAETSMRLLGENGVPLGATTSNDPAPPYAITPPTILEDPNAIEPFLSALGVPPQPNARKRPLARDTDDPIARALAAYIAHVEGQDDVASVLVQPLVEDTGKATGPALALAAVFLEKDPIYPPSEARDAMKDERAAAAKKDPELWWPRLWLIVDEAEKGGFAEAAPKISALADHFREVPEILKGLGAVYTRLGWKVERDKVVRMAAERFPDDTDALHDLLRLDDEDGKTAEADKLAERIRALDPDAEVEFERAIERRDYKAAIKELERLGKLRKDRRDIATRVADLLARMGASGESMEKLEAAVKKNPEDGAARLALADAEMARGKKRALQQALIDAIHSGSDTHELREAIELVDGITELSSYRLDGAKVIKDYEASGRDLPGTAARVLDYSALWIHPDGSARMLEHEILCIQSREGIQEHAEQRLPRGLVLKIRTIKKDGRVLEPEFVEGKATVTMPHLDVGDYIETESITSLRGDGQGGRHFEGPRWFFREEKIPYFRSEFVVVSPKNRQLVIETGGQVPPPAIVESGALITRRWRVDKSPALPEEPGSAPIQEFLPNVRIGWGITLADTVAQLVDAASDETPRDPRILRIAQGIAAGELLGKEAGKKDEKDKDDAKKEDAKKAPEKLTGPVHELPKSIDERARRLYRWVLANVEQGREGDGRRVVIGKTGNRAEAFLYLCRLLGIDAHLGLIRDRLAAPARGPMSEAEEYSALAIRVSTDAGTKWMMVRDKFAPYGYLPSSLRGQEAFVLETGTPRDKTQIGGPQDGVSHVGTAELHADGSATIALEQRYEGKLAIALRNGLETLPDARLKETIEARLLPQTFPGARLVDIEVKNLASLDEPLVLAMKLELSNFARPREGRELVIAPPFPIHVSALGELPTRETPLYISEQIASRVAVQLEVKLPVGATVTTPPETMNATMGFFAARVSDSTKPGILVLDRLVDIPAGRVQPADYPKFQEFARRVDAATHRDLVVSLTR